MDQPRHPTSYSTDELLQLTAAQRQRLIERATIIKRQLRQLAAELTACEECIDELNGTEQHLLAENTARLKRRRNDDADREGTHSAV